MADASSYAARMISALALSEPELDTSIGSPTRKILDAVAEVAAESAVDAHLLNYQFDVDSKVGADLDDFVLTFGFTRFQAQRAVGTVTFTCPSPAQHDLLIPAGTQVVSNATPQVVFLTIAPAYLLQGTTSVDVPVQAVLGGESGNLPPSTLTLLATPVDSISPTTNNSAPTTGGTNGETDAALIARFKKTVFRSMAGTEDMFLGVALEGGQDSVSGEVATQAIVLGASKRWREQVQIQPDGTATSTIPAANVRYVYPDSSVVGTDIDNGAILTPKVHYTFDTSVTPPRIVSVSGTLQVAALYDLDFEYSPMASRNDPQNGITNRVDIWCNGLMPVQATETAYLRASRTFSSTSTDSLYTGHFVRLDTNDVAPSAGNIFVQLAFGPITDFPSTITVAGVTYNKGTDYWVVHDDTAFGYGPTSTFGLEWLASHAPADGTGLSLSGGNAYTYNRVPRDVEDRARQWRLVTTDVRAHAAKRVYLRLNFAVMYEKGFDRTQTDNAVFTALSNYLTSTGFDARVQVSDLIQIAHNVQGVDNIRFLNSAEPTGSDNACYAIEKVASNGTRLGYSITSGSPARATDMILGDNEVPVLYAINTVPKAQNTFNNI